MPIDIKVRQKAAASLKTVGKLGVRTVRGGVRTVRGRVRTADSTLRTAKRIQRQQNKDGNEYAVNQVYDTATDTGRKLSRKINKRGKRAVKSIIQGKIAPIKTVKAGIRGIAPAREEAKNAGKALTAARRSPQATAMIKQAQNRSFKAGKALAKESGKAVVSVVKAVGQVITLLFGSAWILAALVLVIVLACMTSMLMESDEATDIEYTEAGAAVYYFLRTQMDLNPAAACAVMANIEAESGFKTNALGDNGTSYGLCQWHLGRWDRLNEFCVENGYSSGSIQGQLYYFKWELENCYPGVLEFLQNVDDNVGGCYDAASYFCIEFERPDDAVNKGDTRGSNAVEKYWPSYGLADEQWSKQGMALALTAYMELGNEGGEKYWSWWGYTERVEWCAIFVSWCANQNGYLDAGIMPRQQGVDHSTTGSPWYYSHGESLTASPDVVPQPGWVAFFRYGHTGIVYACDGVNAYLVEGNNMDAVRLKSYPLADVHNYLWWCIPPYTE